MFTRRTIAAAAALTIGLMSAIGGATAVWAGSGTIQLEVVKAAFIVGATGGRGTLNFGGKSYPLSVGGVSAGFSFAMSKAQLSGRVKNINRPEDIEGVYSAASAGLAVAAGGKAAVMTNAKGVTIEVAGTEMGLDVSLNLAGLNIKLKR